MTLYFKIKRYGRGRKSRVYKKFRRCILKDWEKGNKEIKASEWDKSDRTLQWSPIKKFLISNIGKPIDKVYSEFLKRWRADKYNPSEEFDTTIKYFNMEVVNGILKRKKEINAKRPRQPLSYTLNCKRWNDVDLNQLIKRLRETRTAQYIGRFYVYNGNEETEESVYMDFFYPDKYGYQILLPKRYHNVKTLISGVGYGLKYEREETSTGKISETYSIITDAWVTPTIYFYYKRK